MPALLLKLLCAAGGLIVLVAGLRWFERANLYPASRRYDLLPSAYGIPYEESAFGTEDGVALHGWFVDLAKPDAGGSGLPAPPVPVAPAIEPGPRGPLTLVLFHGNAGNISHRMDKLRVFRGLGLSVFLFDYRGYGQSGGRPTEQGTYLDGLAAVRFLTEEKRLPQDRLVYYGESLGCAVALETALRRPPAALILDSGFTSTVDMGRRFFPFLPVSLMVRYKYDNLSKIPGLKVPVLLMHSPQDEMIPFSMGRRLFDAAPEPKRFAETRGDHNGGFLQTPRYAEIIRDFLLEAVR